MAHYFKIILFRVMRLWPTLLLAQFIFLGLINQMGDGSSWTELQNMVQDCESNWWTSLLYINDFVPVFSKDLVGCLRWTAVFAVEMQLFLFVPFIAYAFVKGHQMLAIFITF